MSKKKNSTNFVDTEHKDAEIVFAEAIEVAEVEEVVSEKVEKEEKTVTISQETEPSKEVKKMVVSKEKGKIIALDKNIVVVKLQNGTKKKIKRPNYPVKFGDMIDTTI